MAAIAQEIDATLRQLMLKPGIVGYAFFSPDAIPIKHSWPEDKESIVVHYAALISDLMGRT